MKIEIPDELIDRLRRRTVPGITEADALREVLDTVEWMEEDQRREADLARSAELLNKAMDDILAGRAVPAKQALQQVADEFGLRLKQ